MIESKVFERYKLTIEELKPKILDTIIEVYGEKHREQIEDRLNNMYINGYVTAEDIEHDYNKKENTFLSMLSVKFLRQLGEKILNEAEEEIYIKRSLRVLTDKQKEMLEKIFGREEFSGKGKIFSFDDKLLNSEDNFYRRRAINERCEVLKYLGLEISPETYEEVIKTEQGQVYLKKAKSIYGVAVKCREDYDKFKEEHSDYIDYIKRVDEYKKELDFTYLKKFAERILPYCEKEEADRIKEALKNDYTNQNRFIRNADKEEKYFSEYQLPIIFAFSEEAQDKLREESLGVYAIKNNRIKYFKLKGLDLGDNYEDYANSEEAKKLLPDKEVVAKICQIKKECDREKEMEFFFNTGNYLECKKNILALGLHIQDNFSIDSVEQGCLCMSGNAKQDTDGNYYPFSVVHLALARLTECYEDEQIVHEILHGVELNIKQISENEMFYKFGFDEGIDPICHNKDEIIDDYKKDDPNEPKRHYELFSENLHQELAFEVTNRLHAKGIYIYGDPKLAKTRGNASYEQFNIVTSTFQKEYREEIIDGMMAETKDGFTAIVGKDNFERLNTAVREFAELPYNRMVMDYVEKKDTILTRKRTEFINRGKKIVEDMKEYEKNSSKYIVSVKKIGEVSADISVTDTKKAMQAVTNDKNNLKGEHSKNGE